jgi:hypothetical protein
MTTRPIPTRHWRSACGQSSKSEQLSRTRDARATGDGAAGMRWLTYSEQVSRARQPKPPDGLAVFERYVMAADAPDAVWLKRDKVRELLRYVRRLERQYDLLPPDHPAREAAELFAAPVP